MRFEKLPLHKILILPFDKWWQYVLVNVILALGVLIVFFNSAFDHWANFLLGMIWSMAIGCTQWSGHLFINYHIHRKLPILENTSKNILLSIFSMMIYGAVAYVIVQYIMHFIVNGNLTYGVMISILKKVYVPIIIAISISFSFSIRSYFVSWKQSVLEVEKLKNEILSYQYESLRNQINPHFLFNSFNVLSDLIYDDQKQAVDFVQKMSGLFRYVLDSRDKELIKLEDEMRFIDSYIALLKTRFEDKINVDNTVELESDELIVPMAMQNLIENAVKHNEVSSAKPLSIKIFKRDDRIVVENSLQLKKVGDSSGGTGLKNIQQQYKFFTEKKVQIEKSKETFMVSLPLLKAES